MNVLQKARRYIRLRTSSMANVVDKRKRGTTDTLWVIENRWRRRGQMSFVTDEQWGNWKRTTPIRVYLSELTAKAWCDEINARHKDTVQYQAVPYRKVM